MEGYAATGDYRVVASEMEARAQTIDQDWRSQRAAVLNDRSLPEAHRQARLEVIDVCRASAVAALQEEARRYLEEHKKQHAGQLQRAAAADLQRRRELLGDAVIADLWARRLARMKGKAIQGAFEAAVGWEREIVRAYGALALEERRNEPGGFQDPQDALAWNALQVSNSELDALHEEDDWLGKSAQWVEALDLDGQRRSFSSRLGLSYASMLRAADLQSA